MKQDNSRTTPPVPQRYKGRLTKVNEVLTAIESYFEICDERAMSYTIPGLAYYLGIGDIKLLYGSDNNHFRQVKSPETIETVRLFSSPAVQDSLRLALTRIESQRASQLLDTDGNVQALIFDLKATFGWMDKQNLQIENPDGNFASKVVTVLPARPGELSMDAWLEWYNNTMRKDKALE
jgi:hypothetical protein